MKRMEFLEGYRGVIVFTIGIILFLLNIWVPEKGISENGFLIIAGMFFSAKTIDKTKLLKGKNDKSVAG